LKYLKGLHLDNAKGRVGSIHRAAEKGSLLGIYIYNGVESEKHVLFQNPVSELELTPL
jgi:hypothetical protein